MGRRWRVCWRRERRRKLPKGREEVRAGEKILRAGNLVPEDIVERRATEVGGRTAEEPSCGLPRLRNKAALVADIVRGHTVREGDEDGHGAGVRGRIVRHIRRPLHHHHRSKKGASAGGAGRSDAAAAAAAAGGNHGVHLDSNKHAPTVLPDDGHQPPSALSAWGLEREVRIRGWPLGQVVRLEVGVRPRTEGGYGQACERFCCVPCDRSDGETRHNTQSADARRKWKPHRLLCVYDIFRRTQPALGESRDDRGAKQRREGESRGTM